ncbi:unnamed protein product [Acanthocheilonema viteae]|uniref:Uncharacterized protein n=1 Tax=Acanthocheilonema viteae TaxID=6277 RepID=A0A498SKL6_ACAVI|nr:unnamed protein product [Acanthocheilonema viteae]
MPAYKVLYYISNGSNHRLLNAAKEFQKCMNIEIDILLFIETYKIRIWKQRTAGFRYEILPESLIANEKTSCDICSSIDIMNAFCSYADFAPVIGCSDKDEISRIYIAKMEFNVVHIICSPTISQYIQIAREQSENVPCQLV